MLSEFILTCLYSVIIRECNICVSVRSYSSFHSRSEIFVIVRRERARGGVSLRCQTGAGSSNRWSFCGMWCR